MDITINLGDLPTALHKAGLAGLYLALSKLQQFNGQLFSWKLEKDSVTLQGKCSDQEAIEWLLSHTYQLDNEGFIKIPILGNLTIDERVNFHQGMTGTLIFHPLVVKSSRGVVTTAIPIGETQILEVKYKALDYYPHQDLSSLKAFDKKGNFKPSIKIAGWLYPGGSELHVALSGKTKLEESPEGVISLAFAPIVCSYYKIRSRLKQDKYLWALVIPEVEDLEQFTQTKLEAGSQTVKFDEYYASGISDASLRELSRLAGEKAIGSLTVKACEVWAFGSRPWSKQIVITAKQRVEINSNLRKLYWLCAHYLKGGIKVGKNGTFVSVSFGRELATESLTKGQPWYADLYPVLSLSSDYYDALLYERSLLQEMKEVTIENGYVSPNATLFCDGITWIYKQLCYQAFSSTSGKPNYDRVRQDLQMSIRSVKTQEQFVRWLTELVSKPANRNNPFWQEIDLGVFHQWAVKNWQECLSLAALAVLTYKNPWKVERTRNILLAKRLKPPKDEQEFQFSESENDLEESDNLTAEDSDKDDDEDLTQVAPMFTDI